MELNLYTCYYHGRKTKEVIIMFKKKNCPTSNSQKDATNAYQKGYDQAVKDYKALEPFRKYPQRIINVTSKFIKGKMHALHTRQHSHEEHASYL